MRNLNGSVFLVFFLIVIGLLFAAVVWIAKEMGRDIAIGLGIGVFMVLILFAQQILTGIQTNDTTQNLVEYDRNQAAVEEQRARAQVVQVQALRDVTRVQAKIDEAQYTQMRIAAQKMAGMLSEAEIAKIKAEMSGIGMLTDSSQTIELD